MDFEYTSLITPNTLSFIYDGIILDIISNNCYGSTLVY